MIAHIPFYFLRHGETDWNLQRKMMGMADIPLNAAGRTQAEAARLTVAGVELRSIAASSLARAWETAEIVNLGLGLALTPIDDLREVDVGPFEGVSDPDWMNRWQAGEAMAGVEPAEVFRGRIARGLNRALQLDLPVLIVSHGGVFRAIEALIGLSGETDLPNALLARLEPPTSRRGHWRVALV